MAEVQQNINNSFDNLLDKQALTEPKAIDNIKFPIPNKPYAVYVSKNPISTTVWALKHKYRECVVIDKIEGHEELIKNANIFLNELK